MMNLDFSVANRPGQGWLATTVRQNLQQTRFILITTKAPQPMAIPSVFAWALVSPPRVDAVTLVFVVYSWA